VRPRRADALVICACLLALAALTITGLATTPTWRPGTQAAPWCEPGQRPAFAFGFAALAQQLGSTMGDATECEHGLVGSNDSFQKTTTGLAEYDWCTNTPTFRHGQDRWALTPAGVLHWSAADSALPSQPTVRDSDLRHPCPQ
jgi:hypothetical protein